MDIVVVGCGVAGFTAAKAIKEISPQAEITVFTEEDYLYYPRPRLYSVLSGQVEPQEIISFSGQWYEKRGIKVFTRKTVARIDVANNEVLLQDGTRVRYDALLMANGAYPFLPPIKGADKKGVFTLRSLENALTIRRYAENAKKAVVVGGGLLGLEFAASLRKLGKQVDVVEIFPRLLPMQLDQEGSEIFQSGIESLGIRVAVGAKTTEILGDEAASGVSLEDGRTFLGDLILFSAGIRSNIGLAREAGIKISRGIVVDEHLQTSINNVYAAGDVVEFKEKVYGIIPAAEEQAKVAAVNMVGSEKCEYKGTIASNTIKIIGVDLTSIGVIEPLGPEYEEIKKVDPEKRIYKKIVIKQGKIVGAIILGEARAAPFLRRLVEQGVDVADLKREILEDDFDYRRIPQVDRL